MSYLIRLRAPGPIPAQPSPSRAFKYSPSNQVARLVAPTFLYLVALFHSANLEAGSIPQPSRSTAPGIGTFKTTPFSQLSTPPPRSQPVRCAQTVLTCPSRMPTRCFPIGLNLDATPPPPAFGLRSPYIVASGVTNISMFYGDLSDDVSNSNGNDVFLMFDDFNNGVLASHFTLTSADWYTTSVLNGQVQLTGLIPNTSLVNNQPNFM